MCDMVCLMPQSQNGSSRSANTADGAKEMSTTTAIASAPVQSSISDTAEAPATAAAISGCHDDADKPAWLDKNDVGSGDIEKLNSDESDFFKAVIKEYLYPLLKDKKAEEKLAMELRELRNQVSMGFLLLNGIFIVLLLVLQSYTAALGIPWFGCTRMEGGEEVLTKIDPLGFAFLAVFGIIIIIQVCGMLMHRAGTFIHIMSTTELSRGNDDGYTSEEIKKIIAAFVITTVEHPDADGQVGRRDSDPDNNDDDDERRPQGRKSVFGRRTSRVPAPLPPSQPAHINPERLIEKKLKRFSMVSDANLKRTMPEMTDEKRRRVTQITSAMHRRVSEANRRASEPRVRFDLGDMPATRRSVSQQALGAGHGQFAAAMQAIRTTSAHLHAPPIAGTSSDETKLDDVPVTPSSHHPQQRPSNLSTISEETTRSRVDHVVQVDQSVGSGSTGSRSTGNSSDSSEDESSSSSESSSDDRSSGHQLPAAGGNSSTRDSITAAQYSRPAADDDRKVSETSETSGKSDSQLPDVIRRSAAVRGTSRGADHSDDDDEWDTFNDSDNNDVTAPADDDVTATQQPGCDSDDSDWDSPEEEVDTRPAFRADGVEATLETGSEPSENERAVATRPTGRATDRSQMEIRLSTSDMTMQLHDSNYINV